MPGFSDKTTGASRVDMMFLLMEIISFPKLVSLFAKSLLINYSFPRTSWTLFFILLTRFLLPLKIYKFNMKLCLSSPASFHSFQSPFVILLQVCSSSVLKIVE
jgi:hypothetical protein